VDRPIAELLERPHHSVGARERAAHARLPVLQAEIPLGREHVCVAVQGAEAMLAAGDTEGTLGGAWEHDLVHPSPIGVELAEPRSVLDQRRFLGELTERAGAKTAPLAQLGPARAHYRLVVAAGVVGQQRLEHGVVVVPVGA
jgi:hypothetical protein